MSVNIRSSQNGFTVPELMISVTILAMLSISLIGAMTYYFSYIIRNNIAVDMTADSQNLLRATVEELRYGSGVRQTSTLTDPNSPPGGWNTSNSNFIIIISTPAVDSSNNYIIDDDTGDPFNNELVYFKQGTTLYRRTLANTNAPGNTLKRSCPANLANSSCPADTKLIEHVNTMAFTLYDQNDAVTTTATDARSVKVSLSMRRDTFGNPLTIDNHVQVTLRNNF